MPEESWNTVYGHYFKDSARRHGEDPGNTYERNLSGFFVGMQKSPLLSFKVIRPRWGEEWIRI